MRAIWKFGLSEHCTLDIPRGATILTAREQGDDVCIWAEVDPKASLEKREFRVFGTGFELPEKAMVYLGTAQLHEGRLVLHAYEVLPHDPAKTLVAGITYRNGPTGG